MQFSSKDQVIQIPLIKGSPMCPVIEIKQLLHSCPAPKSSPPLPPSQILRVYCPHLPEDQQLPFSPSLLPGFEPCSLWVHAFRRSGVSWAADHNTPLQNLKAHGRWSSSAINCYLKYTPKAASTVATTFQQEFST